MSRSDGGAGNSISSVGLCRAFNPLALWALPLYSLTGTQGERLRSIPFSPLLRFYEVHREKGVKVFGVTIHYVDRTVDGGRIIAQRAIPYEGNDIDELFGLIHAVEHELYPETIARLLSV